MTPLQQIQKLYHRLTPVERKALKVFVGTFSGEHSGASKGNPTRRLDSAAGDWLFMGIIAELSRRGLNYRTRTYSELRQVAPAYEEESAHVRGHLEQQLKQQMKRTPHRQELVALGHVVARALADYRSPVAPLGLKFMLNNTKNTLEAIDNSFPGYLGAGMLPYLLRRPAKVSHAR